MTTAPARRFRLVPIVVALPIFLQNIDLSALNVALPSIARSLRVPALQLSVVVATYAVSLAVFLPLSAWCADRFGPKRTFLSAIVVFMTASALCGASDSAGVLVACRVLQGLGAAMMVPVGRLILLRSIPQAELVMAMVWFTVPPVVGRLAGPLVGGAIVTLTSWRWIFYVNIPLGIVTLTLAYLLLDHGDDADARAAPRLDVPGFLLLSSGLGATLAGFELVGHATARPALAWLLTLAGFAALAAYALYSLRQDEPVIDLGIIRHRTFRSNVIGAAPFRIANSAAPFLLPLMLQLGFGLSPLTSGLVAAMSALGAMSTRAILRPAIERLAFKHLLIGSSGAAALVFASYGLLSARSSHALLLVMVFAGGVLSSLCMVSLNTLGFVDVPRERTSHATAMLAMVQQITTALGVVFAAGVLRLAALLRDGGGSLVSQGDFTLAFLATGACTALSTAFFSGLDADETGGFDRLSRDAEAELE